MKYQQLGTSDLVVSRICFGCWQLSPRFWGEIPLEPWEEALHQAADLGVNFIDTADAYGDGHAEACLGNWFKKSGMRDRFILATKFHWNFEQDERHPDTSYEYILRECDASLRRLQTDHIDLYQVHAFDPLTRPDAIAAAFHQLKRQGKVRWFGVSNHSPEQMRMVGRDCKVVSSQPHYNLIARDIEQDLLPYCLGERIGVIPYSTLYKGLLTGKYDRTRTFDDLRQSDPLFQGKAFHRMLDAMDELRPIASGFGLTVGQLAIRWLLTHPAITAAIVGIKTPDQIGSIVPAADDVLPIDVWHRVAGIVAAAKGEALAG